MPITGPVDLQFIVHYSEELNKERCCIPRKVIQYRSPRIRRGPVQLISPGCHSWDAVVEKEGDNHYITKGWARFIEDTGILDGDFLSFFYSSSPRMFIIKVYEQDGCERLSVYLARPSEVGGAAGPEQHKMGKGGLPLLSAGEGTSGGSLLPKPTVDNEGAAEMDYTDLEAAQRGRASLSQTYFDLKLKGKASNTLYLPVAFTNGNSLHYGKDEELTINTRNGSWRIGVVSNGASFSLSKGWSAFVRGNNFVAGQTWRFWCVSRLELNARLLGD